MSDSRAVTHFAAAADDSWWLKLALEHGADANLVNIGKGSAYEGTPFEFVIDNGRGVETNAAVENAKLLVKHGADINKSSRPDCHPLALAAGADRFRIVLLLLENGADLRRAQYSGTEFLTQIREKCKNKSGFLQQTVRDDLDAVRSCLEANGVDFSDIPK